MSRATAFDTRERHSRGRRQRSRPWLRLVPSLTCEEGVHRFLHFDLPRLADAAISAEHDWLKAALARRVATRRDRWMVVGLDHIRENDWLCERVALLTQEAARRREARGSERRDAAR